mgnify:CR=1 FL=1
MMIKRDLKLSTKKRFLLLFIILVCFMVPMFSYTATNRTSPQIRENNKKLAESIKALTSGETHLNEIADFEWDYLYSFPAGTSIEEMMRLSGTSSKDGMISPSSSDQVNLLFVRVDATVASICGETNNLKYDFDFGVMTSRYVRIGHGDNPLLSVEVSDGIVTLRLPEGYEEAYREIAEAE